mmetsp:Transcript_14891/g.32463  ORF Transcript_14891/g.32463 Transcript_14891/m.32463 type:complete len:307 (+) Transcript_14891:201-1121(+)
MDFAQQVNDQAIALLSHSDSSSTTLHPHCRQQQQYYYREQEDGGVINELKRATQSVRSFLQMREDYHHGQATTTVQDEQVMLKQGRCKDLTIEAIPNQSSESAQSLEDVHQDFIAPCFFRFHFASQESQEDGGDGRYSSQEASSASSHGDDIHQDMGAVYAYAVCLFNTGLALHLSAVDQEENPMMAAAAGRSSPTDQILLRASRYYEATFKILMSRDPALCLPGRPDTQQAIFMMLLAVCTNSAAICRRLGNLVELESCRSKLETLLGHYNVDPLVLQYHVGYYLIVQVAHVVAIAPLPVGAAMA